MQSQAKRKLIEKNNFDMGFFDYLCKENPGYKIIKRQ